MTAMFPSPCNSCKHLIEYPGPPATCAAFPDGIPARYAAYGEPHYTPEGDEVDGIAYEYDPDKYSEWHTWRRWYDRTKR